MHCKGIFEIPALRKDPAQGIPRVIQQNKDQNEQLTISIVLIGQSGDHESEALNTQEISEDHCHPHVDYPFDDGQPRVLPLRPRGPP